MHSRAICGQDLILKVGTFHRQSFMRQKSLKLGAMLEHFKHQMSHHIAVIVELQMNHVVKHMKTLLVE